MKRIPTREPTQEEFEAIFGGKAMGPLARIVWPLYYWWMRHEIAKVKSPKDIALINATPRAQQFWFAVGLVCAIPIVLVLMFLWTR